MGIKFHLLAFISYMLPRAMSLFIASSFSLFWPNLVSLFFFSLFLHFILD